VFSVSINLINRAQNVCLRLHRFMANDRLNSSLNVSSPRGSCSVRALFAAIASSSVIYCGNKKKSRGPSRVCDSSSSIDLYSQWMTLRGVFNGKEPWTLRAAGMARPAARRRNVGCDGTAYDVAISLPRCVNEYDLCAGGITRSRLP
jgi:hypothetical protein